MRVFAWALLVIMGSDVLPPLLLAGDSGSRAEYIGGTVAALPSKSEGKLNTTDENVFLFRAKRVSVRIPYTKINTIEYGQRVNRRYAEAVLISPILLLSKKRRHFLTVDYTDDDGHQQAMVFQVPKSEIRTLLVSLEAKTGRRVEFQDEEARKAGKG
jgi:hypothetical protein